MGPVIRKFTVIVRPAEEGGYWGEVVELTGCASQGETEEELLENVVEAIQACLEAGTPFIEHDVPLPQVWKVPVLA
jgi:predicted RNase H-like HicB family nuclease